MLRRIANILIDWLESEKMCLALKRLIKPIIRAMSNMDTHAKKWLNLCSEPNHLLLELYQYDMLKLETQEPSMELALSEPYYQGPEYDWQDPQAEFIDMSNTHQDFNEESNSMMLVGPMPPYLQRSSQQYPSRRSAPSSSGIKCFRCGGDHMVKDCPEPPPPRPRLPPIERYL